MNASVNTRGGFLFQLQISLKSSYSEMGEIPIWEKLFRFQYFSFWDPVLLLGIIMIPDKAEGGGPASVL